MSASTSTSVSDPRGRSAATSWLWREWRQRLVVLAVRHSSIWLPVAVSLFVLANTWSLAPEVGLAATAAYGLFVGATWALGNRILPPLYGSPTAGFRRPSPRWIETTKVWAAGQKAASELGLNGWWAIGWARVIRCAISAAALTVFLWYLYERARDVPQTQYSLLLWLLYAFTVPAYTNAQGARWRHVLVGLGIAFVGLWVSEWRLATDRPGGAALGLLEVPLPIFARRYGFIVLVTLSSYLPVHVAYRHARAWNKLADTADRVTEITLSAQRDSGGTVRATRTDSRRTEEEVVVGRIQEILDELYAENPGLVNIMVVQRYKDGPNDSLFCIAAVGPERQHVREQVIEYIQPPEGERIGSYFRGLNGERFSTNNANSRHERVFRRIKNIKRIVSEIVVPIRVRGHVVAILTCNAPYRDAYWLSHEDMLRIYADLIAGVVAAADVARAQSSLISQARKHLTVIDAAGPHVVLERVASFEPLRAIGVVVYGRTADGKLVGPFCAGKMLKDTPTLFPTAALASEGLVRFLDDPSGPEILSTPYLQAGGASDPYEPSWFATQLGERLPARARVLLRFGEVGNKPRGVVALYFKATTRSHALLPGEMAVLQEFRDIATLALDQASSGRLLYTRLTPQQEKVAVCFALGITNKMAIQEVTGPADCVSATSVDKYAADACKNLETRGVALLEVPRASNYRRLQLADYWLKHERHLQSAQDLAERIAAQYEKLRRSRSYLPPIKPLPPVEPLADQSVAAARVSL